MKYHHCYLLTATLIGALGCPGGEEVDPLLVTTTLDTDDVADGENSLREALTYASEYGGTVTFVEDLGATITLASEVVLTGSAAFSVDGPGADALTISGSGEHRHLDLTNHDVTLSGLTFTGGELTGGESGGSIRAIDAKLTITDCVFTGNKQDYIIGNGGAIALEGSSSLSVSDSVFTDNQTNDYGGAVYSEATGGMTFEDVRFENNGKSDEGVLGSAIYDEVGNLTVRRATFKGNVGDRGAIYVTADAGTVTLEDVVFEDHAGDWGAAIYLATLSEQRDTVTAMITRGTFTNNTVANQGGAIAADFGIDLTITDSAFTANDALGSGGAIATNGSLTISTSSFEENTAIAGPDAFVPSNGGAISIGGLTNKTALTISDTTFTNNEVDGDGGAIYAVFTPTIELTEVTLTGNSALNGGAASLSVVEDGNSANLIDCTLTGNTAISRGGALQFGSTASLEGTEVSGNTAEFGGGIQTAAGGPLTIGAGSSITGNTATHIKDDPDELVGGGICNDDDVLGEVSLVSGNSPDDLCDPST